jgi:hypothetical protein
MCKPFDIDALLAATRNPRHPSHGEEDIDRLMRRVHTALPAFRTALDAGAETQWALMLRTQMRLVVSRIGGVLAEAALIDVDGERAHRCAQLGLAATSLGSGRECPACDERSH